MAILENTLQAEIDAVSAHAHRVIQRRRFTILP